MLFASMIQDVGGGKVAAIAATFGINAPHLVAQVISFSIVCALLYWLAYQPILRLLDERRQQIAAGQANAQRIRDELDGIERERQRVVAAAQAQAAALMTEARDRGKRLYEHEAGRATAAAEVLVREAREAAAREHARMLAELRREVGRLVARTTAAVVGRVLTPEDERRLAEEATRQLIAH